MRSPLGWMGCSVISDRSRVRSGHEQRGFTVWLSQLIHRGIIMAVKVMAQAAVSVSLLPAQFLRGGLPARKATSAPP